MTVEQHINLSHFLNFTLSPPLCCSLKTANLWNEIKEYFFVYMTASAYPVISKKVENCDFRHNCILETHVCISNPY